MILAVESPAVESAATESAVKAGETLAVDSAAVEYAAEAGETHTSESPAFALESAAVEPTSLRLIDWHQTLATLDVGEGRHSATEAICSHISRYYLMN